MKLVSAQTTNAWLSGDYVGPNRPMARATVQKLSTLLANYRINNAVWSGKGQFSTVIFGQPDVPIELPNIKSIRWTRSVDQDVATCTIVVYNHAPLPLGEVPDQEDVLGQPGYYTPTRGGYNNMWDQAKNGWFNLLMPDRLVRTYEGYGFDPDLPPETDPHMYPSGTWLIDDVIPDALGATITLECRDVGRLLLDQILFPPVVPWPFYPLKFIQTETKTRTVTTKTGTGWSRPRYQTDSNQPYVGLGITDGGLAYVGSDGSVFGHHGRDAFDTSDNTYWLSVGNRPTWSSAFEYIQGKYTGSIEAVRAHVWGGPYKMWVSVKVGTTWQGAHKIPYRARDVNTGANIAYVTAVDITKNGDLTVKLPKTYTGVTAVRLTFSRLYNSGLGVNYRYRAGVRDFEVAGSGSTGTTTQSYTSGNYSDYSEIVKWLVSWAGLYWPSDNDQVRYITRSDGTREWLSAPSDPVLTQGRAWGDIENTGTKGVTPLDEAQWSLKPVMDGIQLVREITGFSFWIAEDGAAVWRLPNLFKLGNVIYAPNTGSNGGRTTAMVTLDAAVTVTDLQPRQSSRNFREKIFVGNISGKVAAVSYGFNPVPSGFRRVGGWTDTHFATTRECQIMADMLTMRAMMEHRTDTLTIAGNPAIQVDDQVKIIERSTAEEYVHYVREISSDWDAETGKWTYRLTTNWLGYTPLAQWAFNRARSKLHADTQAYLDELLGT